MLAGGRRRLKGTMKKKTMVKGPFGLNLAEDTAREIERLLKTLPKEYRALRRKQEVATTTEVDAKEKCDISTITTDSVDSDGEVVLPNGIDLKTYQRNPVVLWSHMMEQPPIGRCLWIKSTPNGMKAKTMYADTDFASQIWSLVQGGFLKGKSIGFLPLDVRPATADEIKSRPDWKSSPIISKSLLLEFSACSVPSNQDALVEAVSKGVADEAMLRKLGIVLPIKKKDVEKAVVKSVSVKRLAKSFRIDPEHIAAKVIERLQNRGRV